eukprot:9268225-Alexandrium_andersonii.AAC.1
MAFASAGDRQNSNRSVVADPGTGRTARSAAGGGSDLCRFSAAERAAWPAGRAGTCLLYTSDAADDM